MLLIRVESSVEILDLSFTSESVSHLTDRVHSRTTQTLEIIRGLSGSPFTAIVKVKCQSFPSPSKSLVRVGV